MTTVQVVETSVPVNNSPIQDYVDYVHPDGRAQLNTVLSFSFIQK